jgi:arginyl-tRNA synthetase
MIAEQIRGLVNKALEALGLEQVVFSLDHPDSTEYGDYAINVSMILSKKIGKNPKELAEEIKKKIEKIIDADETSEVLKVEIAGPGFINFFLTKDFFKKSIAEIIAKGNTYGRLEKFKGQKMLYEYTDPNPFKMFHIGHLMANAIGEAFSRLAEWNGAEVKRMCYGGDVGLHIGKTIWGMIQNKPAFPQDGDRLTDKVKFVGASYVTGNNAYDADEQAKAEIIAINKKIFEYVAGNAVDENIEVCYKKGKAWSVELFQQMYDLLGTKFDYNVFESEVIDAGMKKVLENKEKGIFVESDGAIVFKGEDFGLHTRVFINSEGLPTYEAKEIGLAFKKFEIENWNSSVVVTGSEQLEYYRVVLKALEQIDSDIASRTKHFIHGMMKFATGKMSSRKGNVIAADEFIEEIKSDVAEKIKDRGYDAETEKEVKEKVAIGAFKFIILRQSPGKDVIYDNTQALSFEGDSGPYLQYAVTRAHSVLRKASEAGIDAAATADDFEITNLEKMLYQFPEVVERAGREYAPQIVTTYLTELSGVFNSWYGNHIIVSEIAEAPYRVALTKAFTHVMENGLNILAIPVPSKM